MRSVTFLLVFMFISTIGFSQKLIVKDGSTLRGIAGVVVFNNVHSEISNLNGEISLESFLVGDSLYFQHPSYNNATFYLATKDQELEFTLIEKSIRLDEIVVSVSRWAESSAEFPNKVVGITTKDIDFSNPQTTADVLAQTGEIYVQKSQLGGGSPMIRGFAANRILLTIDGVRLNNAIFRSGNLQNIISIDAHSLERTEVIFGPGSVQYGSDALGGVVNMMTFSTKFSAGEAIINGGSLLRYSSANNERTAHVDLSYSAPKFASVTTLSFSRYDDQKMGRNGPDEYLRTEYVSSENGADIVVPNSEPQKQKFTGFGQFSFIQKLKFKLTDDLTTEAAFYYSNTNNIPRYDRLIQYRNGNLRYSNWYYGPQEWLMAKVDLVYSKKNAFMDLAKLQVAFQEVKESRHDRDFGSDIRRNRFEEVDIFSVNLDFTKPFNERHHLYYGLNAGFNMVSSTANELDLNTGNRVNSATRYPDGSSYNNYAAYLNYEYKPSERVNFLAGVRYSQFILNATFDTTFYPFPYTTAQLKPSAPSASAGIVIKPGEKLTVQANLSTAFRAPNIDDVGKVFDSEPGNVVVPNPNLEPEYAYNFDAGISRKFGRYVKFDFTAFYTLLDNAIVRRDFSFNGQDSIIYDGTLSKVQSLTNTGSAYLYGFNTKIFVDFTQNWSFTSTFNLVKGEDDNDLPLRHVTPAFGSTHLFYKRNRLKLDLYADYSGGFSFNQLAPEEQSKPHLYAVDENGNPFSPSWFTLNFMSSVQLLQHIQMNLGVENILNSRYRTYSSGLVAPGINLVIGVRGYF
jgi:outer membrane receptor protein involved in Fe transport